MINVIENYLVGREMQCLITDCRWNKDGYCNYCSHSHMLEHLIKVRMTKGVPSLVCTAYEKTITLKVPQIPPKVLERAKEDIKKMVKKNGRTK